MFKTILMGWIMINSYSADGDKHNYVLYNGDKNTYVAISVDEPFGKELLSCVDDRCSVKLKVFAECHSSKSYPLANSKVELITTFCSADRVQIQRCTERNSFVIGGRRYC